MSATLLDLAVTGLCPDCAVAVVTRWTNTHRQVVLDPEPSQGGIFAIDENGRAVRRSLVELSEEIRGRIDVGGFAPHECLTWVDRRFAD